MAIQRFGRSNEHGALISRGVIHDGTLFLSGVTANDLSGDTSTQTEAVLAKIEFLLAEAKTGKDNLLTVHIWLADMADFPAMNAKWNAWVDPKKPPARTCVSGQLYHPDCRVEIAATAIVEG
tara:strand:+ start:103 stop:468 length:366 start_codon:yes stop_codon:yes gene_type:complete